MKVFVISLFSATLLIGCAPKKNAEVKTASASNIEKITCELKGEKRDIEIHTNASACEVIYVKGGKPKSVADAVNGPAHCKSVVEKMKGNLEAAGWKCK